MMKFLVVFALVGCALAQKQDKFAGKYVFDLLKAPLSYSEVQAILASRDVNQYPTYNTIPQTNFQCSAKAQPGFYADVDTQCQVFHRCEQSGNRTDYLCPNTTVFNQITLICDSFYNVDCSRSIELEDFANSRLYTNLPLFDTPPADYIAPYQQIIAGSGAVQAKPVPAAAKKISASGSASSRGGGRNRPAAGGRADDNAGDQAAGVVNVAQPAGGDQAPAAVDQAAPAGASASGAADSSGSSAAAAAPSDQAAADQAAPAS